jgi:hypothetical protein
LAQGETAQFNSTETSTWTINPDVGSISATGLYTAPAIVTTSQTVSVTAASTADPTRTGTATITLTPPPSVGVTPSQVTLGTPGTRQFTAVGREHDE